MEKDRDLRRTLVALLTAMAILLHSLEAVLPSPLPWMRLGLANILAVCTLVLFGPRAAFALGLTRVLLGSLLIGTLFSPGFFLSLSGALCATGLMSGLWLAGRRHFGPLGYSCIGAFGHVTGQLLAARLLLIPFDGLWRLLPLFGLLSLVTGVFNGIAADMLLLRLRKFEPLRRVSLEKHP